MGIDQGRDGTKPETLRLIKAADYFLQCRKFADCCKYAVRARDSDPTNPAAIRTLATAAVLSAPRISSTQHDYYAVLNIPCFESDASEIAAGFETLSSIVDPDTNPCHFASEAFDLTIKAWSVLSNSKEKEEFDRDLTRYLSGGGTFWTMCPYCYHVYEYDSIFEDCCLRCANESCRRVLHAVALGGPPPPDVVKKGKYCCPGFMPFAVRGINGEGIGENLWFPFVPAHYVGNVVKGMDLNSASYEDCNLAVDEEKFGKTGFQEHGNSFKAKINNRDANGARPEYTGGNPVGSNVEGTRMKRKSVPWKSKKLLGRGIRIDGEQAHCVYGVRAEGSSYVDREDDHLEPCYGGGSAGGVQFLEGDDDVFVSLPGEFDMGNGRPMNM